MFVVCRPINECTDIQRTSISLDLYSRTLLPCSSPSHLLAHRDGICSNRSNGRVHSVDRVHDTAPHSPRSQRSHPIRAGRTNTRCNERQHMRGTVLFLPCIVLAPASFPVRIYPRRYPYQSPLACAACAFSGVRNERTWMYPYVYFMYYYCHHQHATKFRAVFRHYLCVAGAFALSCRVHVTAIAVPLRATGACRVCCLAASCFAPLLAVHSVHRCCLLSLPISTAFCRLLCAARA